MPKGYKTAKTLDKEAAREALRAIVKEHMAELVAAQIANAKGLKYLIVRNKQTGKFEKLTKELAETILDGKELDKEIVEIWEQAPSVQAFTDLMNRTIDKPTEYVEMDANVDVNHNIAPRLEAGRKRVAALKANGNRK